MPAKPVLNSSKFSPWLGYNCSSDLHTSIPEFNHMYILKNWMENV